MKSTISSKGQITVPAGIRNRLGLHPGTVVQFEIREALIGTHARLQADALLSRDRGFYRRYFRDLQLIDPAAS